MSKNKLQHLPSSHSPQKSVEVVQIQRSGPLPDPAELEGCNRVIPNGAERIIKMAELQTSHRMEIEKHVVFSQQSQAVRGQYFGLLAVLISVGCATYAAISGMQTFASVLGGTTVTSLAVAFLGGKYLQKKDLSEKAKSSPEPLPKQ